MGRGPWGWRGYGSLWGALVLALTEASAACTPAIRPAPFAGARDHVADVSLVGPFSGQVVDSGTKEPVTDATVVGVWAYVRGDGLAAPWGSEVALTRTDRAGRYQLPAAPEQIRGREVKLVSFTLWIYRKGYLGYRSDRPYDGGSRVEFVARHHRVAMRKWQGQDSHAQHLIAMAGPVELQSLQVWERTQANLALAAVAGADAPAGTPPTSEGPTLEVLDASGLLPVDEAVAKTGYAGDFVVKELGDFTRTHFYQGIHLQAQNRDETWDLAYRVWQDPPAGLDSVVDTFEATFPGIHPTGEIGDETWVSDGERVRAVAFIDRTRKVAVLLTCGAMQCLDVETTILLARTMHDRLDRLTSVPVPAGSQGPSQAEAALPPGQTAQVSEGPSSDEAGDAVGPDDDADGGAPDGDPQGEEAR